MNVSLCENDFVKYVSHKYELLLLLCSGDINIFVLKNKR